MENFNLDSNQPGQQFVQEIWARLRHVIPEIPAAVVLVSDSIGRRAKLGHFAPTAWRARGRKRHEVALARISSLPRPPCLPPSCMKLRTRFYTREDTQEERESTVSGASEPTATTIAPNSEISASDWDCDASSEASVAGGI